MLSALHIRFSFLDEPRSLCTAGSLEQADSFEMRPSLNLKSTYGASAFLHNMWLLHGSAPDFAEFAFVFRKPVMGAALVQAVNAAAD
jgi:hypothetical protein